MDQPLYAIGKQIQWEWPSLGEERYVVMMGSLHIEMMFLKTIGDWIDGSGWTEAVTLSDITTSGRAESLTSVSSVTRTRYTHQVSFQ